MPEERGNPQFNIRGNDQSRGNDAPRGNDGPRGYLNTDPLTKRYADTITFKYTDTNTTGSVFYRVVAKR